jgi:hypothetical protein
MELRDFWDQHKGERTIITFSSGAKADGFVQEVTRGVLVLGTVPTPTAAQKRYIPWPNPSVAVIEFIL